MPPIMIEITSRPRNMFLQTMGSRCITKKSRYPRLVRTLATQGHKVVDFACGDNHMICQAENGQVFAWGDRAWLAPHPVTTARGEETLNPSSSSPQLANERIVKMAGGNKFSLVLTEKGNLWGWGRANSGCIGAKNLLRPTKLDPQLWGNEKVVDIGASDSRCLAVTDGEAEKVPNLTEAELAAGFRDEEDT